MPIFLVLFLGFLAMYVPPNTLLFEDFLRGRSALEPEEYNCVTSARNLSTLH